MRIIGVREGAEGRQPLIDFVTEKLPTWLGLPPQKTFTLERVHCTLATAQPGKHRAILVRFLKCQEFVYRETRKHRITHEGQEIKFVQDLAAETLRIRNGFQPIIPKFIEINAFRGFSYNPCRLRVLHGGKINLFFTLREAEKFYAHLPHE